MDAYWVELAKPTNLLWTIAFGGVLIYWIAVIVGAFEMGAGEGVDGMEVETGGVWEVLNFGKVPFSVVVSVMVFVGWLTSLAVNLAYPIEGVVLVASVLCLSAAAGSVGAAVVLRPLRPVFARMKAAAESHVEWVGRIGVVRTGELTDSFGQIEVDAGGHTILMNARMHRGEPARRGDQVLIILHDRDKDCVVVRPLEGPPV